MGSHGAKQWVSPAPRKISPRGGCPPPPLRSARMLDSPFPSINNRSFRECQQSCPIRVGQVEGEWVHVRRRDCGGEFPKSSRSLSGESPGAGGATSGRGFVAPTLLGFGVLLQGRKMSPKRKSSLRRGPSTRQPQHASDLSGQCSAGSQFQWTGALPRNQHFYPSCGACALSTKPSAASRRVQSGLGSAAPGSC